MHFPLPGNKQLLQTIKGTIYMLKLDGSGIHDNFVILMMLNYALRLTVITKILVCRHSEMNYVDVLKTDFSHIRKCLWPLRKKKNNWLAKIAVKRLPFQSQHRTQLLFWLFLFKELQLRVTYTCGCRGLHCTVSLQLTQLRDHWSKSFEINNHLL